MTTTTTDQLDDILERAGADFGKPEKRRERAARLANEGMAAATLDELVDLAHQRCRRLHKVGSWINWATKTQAQWRACVDQLTKMREARAAKAAAAPAAAAPIERVRTPEEVAERQRAMAFLRVRVDGASPTIVALELGLTLPELLRLVDEVQQQRDAAKAAAKAKAAPQPKAAAAAKDEPEW